MIDAASHRPPERRPHPMRLPSMPRRGVSILEFLGLFIAMVGGVVLGSMYLGADVKEMAYTALERAHVIDKRPEPAAPDATAAIDSPAPTATDAAAPTADVPAAGTMPADATAIETTPAETTAEASAPASGFFAREDLITDQQRQALTRAYWDALNVCMQDEVTHRVPAIDAEGNWQLFDYLVGRKEGHVKAADAIGLLDPRGVDDHVVAYSETAQSWHEDGAKLFGRAVDLLTDAPTAQLSGPFAQSWQSASTQHRMEARLLAEKHQAVESYLEHAFQAAPAEATP